MLFLTYSTLNWKTYDKSDIDIGKLNLDDDLEEDIPIIEQVIPPPPPPPPPAAPEVIEVVEDEEEVEETVIESTETDQDEEIEVDEIEIEEVVEDVEVPFAVIENVPVFPGCERGSNADKRKCMSDKIAKFVQRKFNTDLAGDLGLSGRQRISVIFKIDKSGNVTGVRSRAPHPRLEKEAARVINMLPKMKPGRQRGKPVTVPYSLPITFQVQD
jgi:protein TonB